MSWSPASWQTKRLLQGFEYPDRELLRRVLEELGRLPPLVAVDEIVTLKRQLAGAARGKRFLLQGGDCCERFDDCRADAIAGKLKILLKMGRTLSAGLRRVVHVGRIAGQFAKPRSAATETRDGVTLPSYRGDLVHRAAFTVKARAPDPRRLLQAYQCAAATLGFLRRRRVEFFTSHEGLHLDYEQAQTRRAPRGRAWYDRAAHFLWIGDRTRAIDGAHAEFFRGIANPIGLKLGPTATPEELSDLLDILDPDDEPGRMTLIHRFGAKRIERCLSPLIEMVKRTGRRVLWCCDPMHGNTIRTRSGRKTRNFDDILRELDRAFAIHARMGSILGGVHLELTDEQVTECLGGACGLSEIDLDRAYHSDVDPRLNDEQALEVAALIADRAMG
jgi:3-deoxy-7-phosphoheptulonate synthase